VTLHAGQPYLDVAWSIENKPADNWPEAGWLCFPMRVEKPRFRLGRLGGIVDPAKDVVYGANHDVYCLNTGMTAVDKRGVGAALCPLDSPLVSLERPGLWRYSKDFQPKTATAFINLYNNQWGTNFQQWSSGSWTSCVRIWAVHKKDAAGSWVSRAWEARMPLLASAVEGPGGALPLSQTGVAVSREGVLLTAFGPNPDGAGLVLRLWEQTGHSSRCTVTLPGRADAITHAQPRDLRGEPMGNPITLTEDTAVLNVPSFAPVSIVFK
jgi:hypothetical protein